MSRLDDLLRAPSLTRIVNWQGRDPLDAAGSFVHHEDAVRQARALKADAFSFVVHEAYGGSLWRFRNTARLLGYGDNRPVERWMPLLMKHVTTGSEVDVAAELGIDGIILVGGPGQAIPDMTLAALAKYARALELDVWFEGHEEQDFKASGIQRGGPPIPFVNAVVSNRRDLTTGDLLPVPYKPRLGLPVVAASGYPWPGPLDEGFEGFDGVIVGRSLWRY